MHLEMSGRNGHEDMGFRNGWVKVLDQLVEYMKRQPVVVNTASVHAVVLCDVLQKP